MADFIGKTVTIKTAHETLCGRLTHFNREAGKLVVEDGYNISTDIDLLDILEVRLAEDAESQKPTGIVPLKEEQMYSLFYDAFNIYGPFEDTFCCTVSMSLRKFLRDISNSHVAITIGSDDIFGRIGLCFARHLLGRVKELSVEMTCEVCELRTIRYREAFLNSGGAFTRPGGLAGSATHTLLLYACNRHYSFPAQAPVAGTTILLDIPQSVPFVFTGLGLGFKPENYKACRRFFYMLDAGFGPALTEKYNIYKEFKGSLVKEDVD